jgi:hypothetical protein
MRYIYIVCEQLKQGMGNALIDIGPQISLLKDSSLVRTTKVGKQVM